MSRTILAAVVFCALYALSPLLAMRLHPNRYEGGYSRDARTLEERNRSAFGRILGEVRTNLSDLMFVKTEAYLDSGISFGAHVDLDEMASSGGADEHDYGDHDHDHEDEAEPHEVAEAHIPTPEDDFRGFIGHLHREVKPWRDPSLPHQHTSGRELLPWYRLMTITDPHNVRAYMIGAWWLKNERTEAQSREALEFLAEGIRNNPTAFQLHLMRGYVLHENGREEEAADAFVKAAELALQARPPQGTENPNWTNYQEDDARASLRMAVLVVKTLGRRDDALRMARNFEEAVGGDGRLQALIAELEGTAIGPPAPAAPHHDHDHDHDHDH